MDKNKKYDKILEAIEILEQNTHVEKEIILNLIVERSSYDIDLFYYFVENNKEKYLDLKEIDSIDDIFSFDKKRFKEKIFFNEKIVDFENKIHILNHLQDEDISYLIVEGDYDNSNEKQYYSKFVYPYFDRYREDFFFKFLNRNETSNRDVIIDLFTNKLAFYLEEKNLSYLINIDEIIHISYNVNKLYIFNETIRYKINNCDLNNYSNDDLKEIYNKIEKLEDMYNIFKDLKELFIQNLSKRKYVEIFV